VLRRLLALIRRDPVVVGCLLLGVAAFGILRMRGRPSLLAHALGEITPEQQRVIYLRFIADLDSKEIAQVMGKPEDDVRMLQLDAFRRLLRILDKDRR
jgi:Sigma-70, region 4